MVSCAITKMEKPKRKSFLYILKVLTKFRWEIAIGAMRAGLVLCPCTTLAVAKDIAFRADASGASIFVGDTTSINSLLKVSQSCPKVTTILQAAGSPIDGIEQYEEKMNALPVDTTFIGPATTESDPALIYFTSGTTDMPKMVLHNHVTYPQGKCVISSVFSINVVAQHTNNHRTRCDWQAMARP